MSKRVGPRQVLVPLHRPVSMLDQRQLNRVRLFVEQMAVEVAALDRSAEGEARLDTAELLRDAKAVRRRVNRIRDWWIAPDKED